MSVCLCAGSITAIKHSNFKIANTACVHVDEATRAGRLGQAASDLMDGGGVAVAGGRTWEINSAAAGGGWQSTARRCKAEANPSLTQGTHHGGGHQQASQTAEVDSQGHGAAATTEHGPQLRPHVHAGSVCYFEVAVFDGRNRTCTQTYAHSSLTITKQQRISSLHPPPSTDLCPYGNQISSYTSKPCESGAAKRPSRERGHMPSGGRAHVVALAVPEKSESLKHTTASGNLPLGSPWQGAASARPSLTRPLPSHSCLPNCCPKPVFTGIGPANIVRRLFATSVGGDAVTCRAPNHAPY